MISRFFFNPFALHSLSLISSSDNYNKLITEIGKAYFLQLTTGATQEGPTETDVGGFMGLSCVSELMVGSSCVSGFRSVVVIEYHALKRYGHYIYGIYISRPISHRPRV